MVTHDPRLAERTDRSCGCSTAARCSREETAMIRNYLKLALKVLARRKFFTFISLFGISITLLVLIVASAMLDHAFAPPRPRAARDRTLGVYRLDMTGPDNHAVVRARLRLPRPLRAAARQPAAAWRRSPIVSPRRHRRLLPAAAGRSSPSSGAPTASTGGSSTSSSWKGGRSPPPTSAAAGFVAVINETTRHRFFGGAPAVGRDARGRRPALPGGRRGARRARSCASSRTPTSGCRSAPPSRAPTGRAVHGRLQRPDPGPRPRRLPGHPGGVRGAPARGRAAPAGPEGLPEAGGGCRHAFEALLPADVFPGSAPTPAPARCGRCSPCWRSCSCCCRRSTW